jgi:hypothetical protein
MQMIKMLFTQENTVRMSHFATDFAGLGHGWASPWRSGELGQQFVGVQTHLGGKRERLAPPKRVTLKVRSMHHDAR